MGHPIYLQARGLVRASAGGAQWSWRARRTHESLHRVREVGGPGSAAWTIFVGREHAPRDAASYSSPSLSCWSLTGAFSSTASRGSWR